MGKENGSVSDDGVLGRNEGDIMGMRNGYRICVVELEDDDMRKKEKKKRLVS